MRRWLPVFFIAGAVVFSLAVYSRLPESVPVHWNIAGEPDRFGSRLRAAFLIPAIMTAVFLVCQWFPTLDPRAKNIAKFRAAYDTVVAGSIATAGAMHIAGLGSALGWRTNVTTVALASLGILLILIGNLLPLARSNFVFGIRTPWTLSSDTVWTRSHRVGGYATIAAGILTIAGALIGGTVGLGVAVASPMAAAAVAVVYSYIIWNREQRQPGSTQP